MNIFFATTVADGQTKQSPSSTGVDDFLEEITQVIKTGHKNAKKRKNKSTEASQKTIHALILDFKDVKRITSSELKLLHDLSKILERNVLIIVPKDLYNFLEKTGFIPSRNLDYLTDKESTFLIFPSQASAVKHCNEAYNNPNFLPIPTEKKDQQEPPLTAQQHFKKVPNLN